MTLRISWNAAHIWGVVYGWSCTVWWPELESGDDAHDAHLCYSTSWNKNVKKSTIFNTYVINNSNSVLAYTFSVNRGLYHSSARATSGCSRSCRPNKKKVWIIDYRGLQMNWRFQEHSWILIGKSESKRNWEVQFLKAVLLKRALTVNLPEERKISRKQICSPYYKYHIIYCSLDSEIQSEVLFWLRIYIKGS